MAKPIGDIEVALDGATYTLHMGFRELGVLQSEFGRNLVPLLVKPDDGELPDLAAYLRVVEVSLRRYHPQAAPTVADDIMAADIGIVAKLLAAAFPDALKSGADGGPEKPEAGRT
jgi:hypothetical protein